MLTGTVLIVIALAVGWMIGSLALRAAGLLGIGLGAHLVASDSVAGLIVTGFGGLAWLAGHWLYGLRHHTYRSPLARRIYTQLLPRRLDPTHNWAIPIATRAQSHRYHRDAEARHG